MALAKTVKRMFPTENAIGIHLVLTDDDRLDLDPTVGMKHIVIDTIFKRGVPTNDDMSDKVQQELGKEAQAAIDLYKKLKARFVKPIYQTKVTQIDNNLTL